MKHSYLALALTTTLAVSCSDVKFENLPEATGIDNGSNGNFPPDDPRYKTESFTQFTGKSLLDILFVIDDSQSMEEDQVKLGQRLANFTSKLNAVNWQIGITTTDVSVSTRGELQTFPNGSLVVDVDTPNVNAEFLAAVTAPGANGSGDEQAMRAIQYTIEKRNGKTAPLFRNDADLAVVVLSDEDEMSNGQTSGATSPQTVLDVFNTAFGPDRSLAAFGVIIEPGDATCLASQNDFSDGFYGTFVNGLVTLTGGTTSSICDADFAQGLEKIADHAQSLRTSIQLSQAPSTASVVISLVPVQNIPFAISGRRVIFKKPPQAGTAIKVKYIPQNAI